MPAIPTTAPTACTALGRSPVAIPTTTGTSTAIDEIGATTLIFPAASPR